MSGSIMPSAEFGGKNHSNDGRGCFPQVQRITPTLISTPHPLAPLATTSHPRRDCRWVSNQAKPYRHNTPLSACPAWNDEWKVCFFGGFR